MAADDDQAPTALVLDAGGARSAYQVGALEVLLPAIAQQGPRPTLLIGTSAGALLSAALTATAHLGVAEQVANLREVLMETTKPNVIQPLWRQTPAVALRYVSETVGISRFRLRGLFGTGPLATTLGRVLDWEALHTNIAQGEVALLASTTTAVRSGRVTMFTESSPGFGDLPNPPRAHHRHYVTTALDVPHLMASAAIPALFPSVHVTQPRESAGWYVDGATRRRHPLAPAIELGAARVCVVGTGSLDPVESDGNLDDEPVDLGDAGATLLGSVMDDPLRRDLRLLAGVNLLAGDPKASPHLDRHRADRDRPPYRVVPYAAVAPRKGDELSDLAIEVFRSNHRSLRGTLVDPDLQIMHRLMGSDSPLQGELLSYLMFDADFFTEAAALGSRDAQAWVDEHPNLWRTEHLDEL